jgi:ABC-2 type transport system permease protein
MNPVFQREMRTQARSPQPWRLRLLATSLSLGVLALLLWNQPALFVGRGTEAFFAVNFGSAVILAIIGPMLTHDLLSRERREGTLGLLCSTPLTSREMVLGKASSALLQAVAVWLVMTPILMLPLLQGGVQLADVVLMIALQGGVTISGLASGLAASAWNRSAGWALLSGYALLLLVMIAILIPAGVVVAVVGGTPAVWYTLAAVAFTACALVAAGFYYLAAQESEHAWNRIQFLGEAGDEVLSHLGYVAPEPPGSAPGSTADPGRAVALPSDAEVERSIGLPRIDDATASMVETPRWATLLLHRHRLKMRARDPWRWLVERRREPGWMVPLALAAAYVWWLGIGLGRKSPTWPEWVLPGAMVLRMPHLLREERRNGMLEVLATCPTFPQLPGGVCRMVWWEFGPLLALHAVFALGSSWVMGVSRPMVGLVTATLAVVIGPCVGLWVARWSRNYFIGVLACLVGTVMLGWVVGWLLSILIHRWAVGDWRIFVWPIEGLAPSSLMLIVPPFVQIAVGIAAVRSVRRWVSGGGTGQRGV